MRGVLGEKIGEGVFADIHAWTPGQVVKLFKGGIPRRVSRWEARMTRAVFAAGGPAPEVLGEVSLDGRCGIVLPRLEGPTLLQLTKSGASINFRGAGASSGHASGAAADADADYRAAVDHLLRKQHGPYVAAGYSFGATAAIRVAAKDHRIERLLVVAPPVAMLDVASLRAFHGAVTFIVGDADMYALLSRVTGKHGLDPGLDCAPLPECHRCLKTRLTLAGSFRPSRPASRPRDPTLPPSSRPERPAPHR